MHFHKRKAVDRRVYKRQIYRMDGDQQQVVLSSALEDYLETIFEIVRERKMARVKEIARRRGVRPASVTPAMRRLADLDLINYIQREYIDLTPEGERLARRVYARHKVLDRFFSEVLQVPRAISSSDACAMEHAISDHTMDHMVRFLEFLIACPEGKALLEKFHGCAWVNRQLPPCTTDCERLQNGEMEDSMSVRELKPGNRGRVIRVEGDGAIRQRLLDMGVLPNVIIEMERLSPAGDPLWIRLQGTQLSLRRKEASAIRILEV